MRSILGYLLAGIFCLLISCKEKSEQVSVGIENIKQIDDLLDTSTKEKNIDIHLLDSIIVACREINYVEGELRALLSKAEALSIIGDYQEALSVSEMAADVARLNKYYKELSSALRLKGGILGDIKLYNNSAESYFESLKFSEIIKDTAAIADAYGSIGNLFNSKGDYEKAYTYYLQSFDLSNQLVDKQLLSKNYNNFAILYTNTNKLDTAIYYFNKSYEIDLEFGDKLSQGISLYNIGFIYLKKKEPHNAKNYFKKSLALFQDIKNNPQIAKASLGLAQCNIDSIDISVMYLEKAYNIGIENNIINIIRMSSAGLKHINLVRGDTISAYHFFTSESLAKDSLIKFDEKAQLSKIEIEYHLEKEKLLMEYSQKKKSFFFIIAILVLLLFALGLIVLYNRIRLTAKNSCLREALTKKELSFKEKELSFFLIALGKTNETISETIDRLLLIKKLLKEEEGKEAIKKLTIWIRQHSDTKMLDEFSARFQNIHIGFYESMLKKHPDLSNNELKLCGFLRLNLTTKEISQLTGQRLETVEHARYRLRKKLGIGNTEINVFTYLSSITD